MDLGAPILKTLAPWKEGYDKPRQILYILGLLNNHF